MTKIGNLASLSSIKTWPGRVWRYAMLHKLIAAGAVIVVVGGGYYTYNVAFNGPAATKYVLAAVQQGTFIASVTGTGQVSASTELNVNPQTSGTILSIPVTEGETVQKGQVLANLDPSAAEQQVASAQISLENAQLSLEQLEQPPTQLQLTQDQNSIDQDEASEENGSTTLANDYQTSFNDTVTSFDNLPGVMSGLNTILDGTANFSSSPDQTNANAYENLIAPYNPNAEQYESLALESYATALAAYNQNLSDYTNDSRYSSTSTIVSLLTETYATTNSIAEAVKDTKDFLDLVNTTLSQGDLHLTPPAVLTTHENDAASYTSTVNGDLSNLLGDQNSIENQIASLNTDALNLTTASETLEQLQSGPTQLQIQAQQLSIQSAQNNLANAQQTLAYCTVRAPFTGVIAALPLIPGDQASSGSTIATLITTQGVADIQLNEVDAAKIQLGDNVTLTFTALPNVMIAGTVSEIDTIGTVSQGVVTFDIEITFDSQNTQIKPGMSVSAAIVSNVEPNVLMVPNSAIQTQGSSSFVEVLNVPDTTSNTSQGGITSAVAPTLVPVQIGDANDTETVVTSGLTSGQMVVTRTISASSNTAAATTGAAARTTGFGGGGGFGGGATRAIGL